MDDEFEDFEAFGGGPSFEDELAMEEAIEREAMGPPIEDFEDEEADVQQPSSAPARPAPASAPQRADAVPTAAVAPPAGPPAGVFSDFVDGADLDAAMDEAEEEEEEEEERDILRCFAVPNESGEKTSLRMFARRPARSPSAAFAAENHSLLSQPMSAIRDAIDRQAAAETRAREEAFAAGEAKAAEAAEAAEAAAAVKAANGGDAVDDDDDSRSGADDAGAGAGGAQGKGKGKGSAPVPPAPPAALWVEKYAPKKFVDLLSDERLNRHVLRWVKEWDGLVFGRHPPVSQANLYGGQVGAPSQR